MTISGSDKTILRDLAKRVADIAADSVRQEQAGSGFGASEAGVRVCRRVRVAMPSTGTVISCRTQMMRLLAGQRRVELFFDLVAESESDVASLISHREPFTKAPRLYQMLLNGRARAMGVILRRP